MPVHIENVQIWPGDNDPSQTHTQKTEYSATVFVESLKFKLCNVF